MTSKEIPDSGGMASEKTLRDVVADSIVLEAEFDITEKLEIDREHLGIVFERMAALLGSEAEQLRAEAQAGDTMALDYLLQLATTSCRQLQELCLANPELVRPLAEKCPAWPVLTNNSTLVCEATKTLLEAIHVAEKASTPLDVNKFFDRTTPAREVLACLVPFIDNIRDRLCALRSLTTEAKSMSAIQVAKLCQMAGMPLPSAPPQILDAYVKRLALEPITRARLCIALDLEEPFANPKTLDILISDCAALPKLNGEADVINAWMRVIRRLVTEAHDGHPEKSSKLRALGQSRATKTETSHKGSATSEANIRDGIFLSLRQTLRNMAPT